MTGPVETPIACTLDAHSIQGRLTNIAALNARALLRWERRDLVLTLDYAPQAIDEVQAMVDAEARCCAFLAFSIEATPEWVRVTVTAPEAARDAADTVFAPLCARASTSGAAPDCGCSAPQHASGLSARAAAGLAAIGLSGAAIACAAACAAPALIPLAGMTIVGGAFTLFAGMRGVAAAAVFGIGLLTTSWLVMRRRRI